MKGPDRVFGGRSGRAGLLPALAALLFVGGLSGQDASPNPNLPEITTRESEPAFRIETERNLVVVRVVVRDAQSRAVSGLRQEDFRVLDNGKAQTLASFAVEKPGAPSPAPTTLPVQP